MYKIKLALVPMLYSSGADPPLGLGSIATYLREYANFSDTVIIDAKGADDIIREIRKEEPTIIGLSAKTMHYSKACTVAKKIREEFGGMIIIGGVHISTLPSSLDPVFDLGVVGEGEETMLELINYIREGRMSKEDLRKIKGLVFFDNGELVVTEQRPLIQPLDRIPIVDRKFFSKRVFKKSILETRKAVRLSSIMTSRGCPYHCRFCSTSSFWRQYRTNSVKRVAEEIEYLCKQYEIEHISIWDDLFLCNKDRIKEIIEELKSRGLLGKVKFNAFARANLIDDELCMLAKELGVVFFNFGFESGSDRLLKYLKRDSVSVEDNRNAVITAGRYGISVGSALIMGSPTETLEDMEKTIEFIRFLKKHPNVEVAWLSTMVPLPGTEMWDIAVQRGKVSNSMKDWTILSEYHIGKPLLLDENIDFNEYMKVFSRARAEIRHFELRLWLRRFSNNPFTVMKIALRGFNFIKFFTLKRAE